MKKTKLFIISSLLCMYSIAQTSNTYSKSIEDWHQIRIDNLKKPNGWLNLEGLFWLKKGKNSFGQAEGNDCKYQNPNSANVFFPNHIGDFLFEGDSVVWVGADKYAVTINKQLVEPGKKVLVFRDSLPTINIEWRQFSWTIIKREEKIGVRFRNIQSNNILHFKGIERFPVDTAWRVKATLLPPTQDFLMITNVLGQTTSSKNAGKLVFTIQGKAYSLDVLDEGGKTLFITFADQTAGKTTYGAGRFIDIARPDANGNTNIDFNLAYNPPVLLPNLLPAHFLQRKIVYKFLLQQEKKITDITNRALTLAIDVESNTQCKFTYCRNWIRIRRSALGSGFGS